MLSLERYLADLRGPVSDKLSVINNIKNVLFHGLSLDDLTLAAYVLFSKSSKVFFFFFSFFQFFFCVSSRALLKVFFAGLAGRMHQKPAERASCKGARGLLCLYQRDVGSVGRSFGRLRGGHLSCLI